MNVRDQHDPVTGRDAEQSDEANDGGKGKHSSREEDACYTPGKRERQVEHDDKRVLVRLKRHAKDQENTGDHSNAKQRQPLVSAFRAFELSAVFDAVALRQFEGLVYPLLNLLNGASKVPSGDVALHHDP